MVTPLVLGDIHSFVTTLFSFGFLTASFGCSAFGSSANPPTLAGHLDVGIPRGPSFLYTFVWVLLSNLGASVTVWRDLRLSLQLSRPCTRVPAAPSEAHPIGPSPGQPVLELTTLSSWPNS